MTARKIYTFRLNDATPDDHPGRVGEITYRDGYLYYHDGVIPGGELIGGGGSGGGGSTTWTSVTGKPSFAAVATSGSYNDLTSKPSIPSKVSDLTNDSGFITSLAWTAVTGKPALFSGTYADLTGKPSIPSVPTTVSSFTNDAGYLTSVGTISYNDLSNKPSLFSGTYADLTGKPTIPSLTGYATELWVTSQGYGSGSGGTGAQGPQGEPGAAGADGNPGVGVPTGGTVGQVLAKIDSTDYNTEWVNQTSGGGGNTGTVWTNSANGCLRAELSETGFQAFTDATHLDLQDGGQWTIGSYQNSTFIGNDEFTNTNILSLRSGDETYITTNLRENGNHQWKFGADGTLTLPGNYSIGPGEGSLAIISESAAVAIIADSSNSNQLWIFGTDGTLTFPDNKISQVSDSNLGVQTSKTVITDNIWTVGSGISTNIDEGYGVVPGWDQRNPQEIEIDLFTAAYPLFSTLPNLALGSTVIVTYSTAGSNATYTGLLSQQFTIVSNYGSQVRLSGRINGTLPVEQTGIVSINFPEYSTQNSVWTFGTDGKLQLPSGGTILSGDSLSGVKLSFTDAEFTDGKYITVRAGGDNYNHLHIDSGDNSKFDLFLGDDNNYVKVNHTGDINVVAVGNADILGSTNTNIHTTAGDVNIYTADHNGNSSGFPVAGVLLQNPVIVQTSYGTVWDNSVPWAVPGARLRFWGLDQNTGHALPVEPAELNDFFYVGHDGSNNSNFALYHDEALTQPVDGTGWTGPYNGHDYGIFSGGWIGLPEIAGDVNISAGSTHSWGVPGKVNITTHYKDASSTQHAVTWAFNADGVLTLPDNSVIASYKPVTVIAGPTGVQTISDNASATRLTFIESVDSVGAFTDSTFTVPYTGYYQFNATVYFTSDVTLTDGFLVIVNTTSGLNELDTLYYGAHTGRVINGSSMQYLTAGDTVALFFRQVSGNVVDIGSSSRLTIHRVSIG